MQEKHQQKNQSQFNNISYNKDISSHFSIIKLYIFYFVYSFAFLPVMCQGKVHYKCHLNEILEV